jgi:hypothetical protein
VALGVAGPPPRATVGHGGWLQAGWSGVAKATPRPNGGPWGGPATPKGHGGGVGHPQLAGLGWPKPPPWPLGVDRPPPTAKANFFKKICLALRGWPDHPKGHRLSVGWLWPPQTAGLGGRSHPQGQTVALGGGPATPRATSTNIYIYIILLFIF